MQKFYSKSAWITKSIRARFIILLAAFLHGFVVPAQKPVVDSIRTLLSREKIDSNKVTLLWNLANAYNAFNPDSALLLSQKALTLARKIKFIEGESRSMGILANSFKQIGNYPKALEFYLLKLKLEENRDNPHNMANVILNIGVVYSLQEEYEKALTYYYQADSIMNSTNDGDPKFALILKYSIALNIGDLYNHINKLDSALSFFQQSQSFAKQQVNGDFTGISMVGIGEVYLKKNEFVKSRDLFKGALFYLEEANDEDVICEASLGLANLYDSLHQYDSVYFYAHKMLYLAKKDGFLNWQLMASDLLDAHYKKLNRIDSAYNYRVLSQQLHDSISSRNKIRQSQIISSNEELRQADIADQKIKAKKERKQQLQFLFIGIFIPAIFLITLILSRRRIHVRVIKFLGIISLLILFEYFTLLLHPYIAEITNHTPILELLIFVVFASILIRVHHRLEHWFINKLITGKNHLWDGHIPINRIKLKIKKHPDDFI